MLKLYAAQRIIARFFVYFIVLMSMIVSFSLQAHHVLGRPAYNLNEDSNTPPSMQIETEVGDYFINFAVFPAFPKPGETGRVNLYIVNTKTNQPPQTSIEFSVRDDAWFSSNAEYLGTQNIDDGIYRQAFIFSEKGAYIISAKFNDGIMPYTIDFPIRIGEPPVIGPIGVAIGVIAIILISVNLVRRKRSRKRKPVNHIARAE